MTGRFVLKSTGKGKFSFNLQAGNWQNILSSESYTSKSAALNGIKSVRVNAKKDGNFERRTAKNGQPYFVLTANKREVIGKSEMYASTRNMEKGIASVKANATTAGFEDLTIKK
jgi:uncharacterized protein